jgi:protoheme IX farnesyltransferase
MVNPTTACLGLANIVLYSGVYTWMKRRSVVNTWVGSIVGAIPPLMGWTASGGHILPTSTSINLFLPPFLTDSPYLPLDSSLIDNPLSAIALFTLLYSWQFPHFNSLSYIVRDSYAQASYRMLAVFSPKQNALVAFRHSVILAAVCSILIPMSGLTNWMFSLTSLLPNVVLVRAAYSFWKHGGEKEARKLWKISLWYLPAVLGLMMFHKQGMEWVTWLGLSKGEGNSKAIANDSIVAHQQVI